MTTTAIIALLIINILIGLKNMTLVEDVAAIVDPLKQQIGDSTTALLRSIDEIKALLENGADTGAVLAKVNELAEPIQALNDAVTKADEIAPPVV